MQCNLCPSASNFHNGLYGENSKSTGIMLVLHCQDSRVNQKSLFGSDYEHALLKTRTGKAISRLLAYSILSFEDVLITNYLKCVMQNPKKEDYRRCHTIFEAQLDEFQARKLVLFGKPARILFDDAPENGEKRKYRGIETLIMPHPSTLFTHFTREKRGELFDRFYQFLSAQK